MTMRGEAFSVPSPRIRGTPSGRSDAARSSSAPGTRPATNGYGRGTVACRFLIVSSSAKEGGGNCHRHALSALDNLTEHRCDCSRSFQFQNALPNS